METTNTQHEPTMHSEPQREHQWLQKLVGEWTVEIEATMQPGQPPEQHRGTESVRSLGGLWTIGEGTGAMPGGGEAKSIMTLGYDPRTERYRGTFVASMMTHLWIYDGELDAAEHVLTLNTEGPSMAGNGTMAKFRDVIEFISDDHRTMKSYALTDDGTWQQFMTAHYRRVT